MTSWIYLFSKFTAEALLFEALIICSLFCIYAAFWVLRKRKFGIIEKDLPSGPVKAYLNDLITQAEHLRMQLFGLLSSPEHALAEASHSPEDQSKIAELQAKIVAQAEALDALATRTDSFESDSIPTDRGEDSAPSNDAETKQLKAKLKSLEDRLAEYSVIEDDLANLKTLQQENQTLKATLSSNEIPLPASASPSPAPSKAGDDSAEPTVAQTTEMDDAAEPSLDSSQKASQKTSKEKTETQEEPPADPDAAMEEEIGEELEATDAAQIDEALGEPEAGDSLEASQESADTDAAKPKKATAAAAPEAEDSGEEADLVAEFEKMLKG